MSIFCASALRLECIWKRSAIICGGLTDADGAGLNFALAVGLVHSGYIPQGRKAEDGRIDEKYQLVELSNNSYPVRTKRNIRESDGRVIFSLYRRSPELISYEEVTGWPFS